MKVFLFVVALLQCAPPPPVPPHGGLRDCVSERIGPANGPLGIVTQCWDGPDRGLREFRTMGRWSGDCPNGSGGWVRATFVSAGPWANPEDNGSVATSMWLLPPEPINGCWTVRLDSVWFESR